MVVGSGEDVDHSEVLAEVVEQLAVPPLDLMSVGIPKRHAQAFRTLVHALLSGLAVSLEVDIAKSYVHTLDRGSFEWSFIHRPAFSRLKGLELNWHKWLLPGFQFL